MKVLLYLIYGTRHVITSAGKKVCWAYQGMQILVQIAIDLSRLAARCRYRGVLSAINNCRSFANSPRLLDLSKWGTKKKERKIKLNYFVDMSDPQIEAVLAPLRANVKEQVNNCHMLDNNDAITIEIKFAL